MGATAADPVGARRRSRADAWLTRGARVRWAPWGLAGRDARRTPDPGARRRADGAGARVRPCGFSTVNKGDAALVMRMIECLRREFGGVEVTVTTLTPDRDGHRLGVRVLPPPLHTREGLPALVRRGLQRLGLGPLQPYASLAIVRGFVAVMTAWRAAHRRRPALLERLLPRDLRRVVRAIADADVAVAVPGGYLIAPRPVDDYWLFHLAALDLVRLMDKPLVIYPCSAGPFSGIHRRVARRELPRFEHVLVREPLSERYLLSIGVPAAHLDLLPDAAFILRPSDQGRREAAAVVAQLEGLPRPWIGVSVRHFSFPEAADPQTDLERYYNALAETIDALVERSGGSVVIVPQTAEDLPPSKSVYERVRRVDDVVLRTDDLSPHGLMGLYEEFELMVGTRMHANVLGMLASVPVVAIAYEPKTQGIMEMLGLDDCVIPISETSALRGLALRVWDERAAVRSRVAAGVAELQRRADEAGRHVRLAVDGARGRA